MAAKTTSASDTGSHVRGVGSVAESTPTPPEGESWCEHYTPGDQCPVCSTLTPLTDYDHLVWAWLNRHDAPWSPSDAKVRDLAFRIAEAVAAARADERERLACLLEQADRDGLLFLDGPMPGHHRVPWANVAWWLRNDAALAQPADTEGA
jgi:hypothetical protein